MARHRDGLIGGRRRENAGIALLTVVVVLSTLLIIGVLFAITVDLDFKASKYYRKAGEAEQYALEGAYRAMAELQYDMWGVNESQAFRLANSDLELTYDGDDPGTEADAAYYRIVGSIDPDPGAGNDLPIIALASKWRRTIESIQNGPTQSDLYYTLTDYRWVVEKNGSGEGGVSFANDNPKRYIHSGSPYHDEFLPDGSDVADAFQLGLHVNRQDVYYEQNGDSYNQGDKGAYPGRLYANNKNDKDPTYFNPNPNPAWLLSGGNMQVTNPAAGVTTFDTWFWQKAYQSSSQPWLQHWDHIDSRINGDSFYKIFRTELVYYDGGSGQWRSNSAGVYDRMDGVRKTGTLMTRSPTNWKKMRTHLGVLNGSIREDPRGGAENINQVNNDYRSETSFALRLRTPSDPTNNPYTLHHYRESKWIYVYDESGEHKKGRYAVMVWPDCGHPNINYLPDVTEQNRKNAWESHLRPEIYFNILDAGTDPRGGPIGLVTDDYTSADIARLYTIPVANLIKSNANDPYWSRKLMTAIENHVETLGPASSRAELNMFLRKRGFTLGTVEEREADATIITENMTVHGYEVLMGPHWEVDRVVVDYLGHGWNGWPGGSALSSPTAFGDGVAGSGTAGARDTRSLIWHYLDNLRFYWGPDDIREGKLTPFSQNCALNVGSGLAVEEHQLAKSQFFAHILAASNNNGWSTTQARFFVDASIGADVKFYKDPTAATHPVISAPIIARSNTLINGKFLEINETGQIWITAGDDLSAAGVTPGTYNYIELANRKVSNCVIGTRFGRVQPKLLSFEIWGGAGALVADTTGTPPGIAFVVGLRGDNTAGPDDGAWADVDPTAFSAAQANGFADPTLPANQVKIADWGYHSRRNGFTYRRMPAKDSAANIAPADYILVLLDPNVTGDRIRLSYDSNIMDYIALPNGASLADGWSCFDFFINQHPFAWMPTNNQLYNAATNTGWATPAWRGKAPYASYHIDRDPNAPAIQGRVHDKATLNAHIQGSANGPNRAWYHGMNRNHTLNYYPGAEAWPSPRTPSLGLNNRYSTISVFGLGSQDPTTDPSNSSKYARWSGLRGCNYDDVSWPAACNQAWFQWCFDNDGKMLRGAGRFPTIVLGFLPRLVSTTGLNYQNTLATSRMADPLLRFYSDLMMVSPVHRYITPGWMRWNAADHHDKPVWDQFDNNLDGRIDEMTPDPIFPGAPLYQNISSNAGGWIPKGHFVGDRAAIGRINANEIIHPATVWSAALGSTKNRYDTSENEDYDYANVVIGRKPFNGYMSWVHVLTRAAFVHMMHIRNKVPYHLGFWYENMFADYDTIITHGGNSFQHRHHATMPAARYNYAGVSPVHTIYVTAQSIDDQEEPQAEVKIMATVERTWDGKINFLDFKWIPSEIKLGR